MYAIFHSVSCVFGYLRGCFLEQGHERIKIIIGKLSSWHLHWLNLSRCWVVYCCRGSSSGNHTYSESCCFDSVWLLTTHTLDLTHIRCLHIISFTWKISCHSLGKGWTGMNEHSTYFICSWLFALEQNENFILDDIKLVSVISKAFENGLIFLLVFVWPFVYD